MPERRLFNPREILTRSTFFSRITHDLINRHNERSRDTLIICGSAVVDESDTCVCGHCDELILSNDSTSVHVRRNGEEQWCESCLGDHGFRCADCDDYFDNDLSCGQNASGNQVCESCAESYFYCEHCEAYLLNRDYGEDGRCVGCTRESEDSIPGYHDTRRNYTPGTALVYGIELEIKASDEEDCISIYKHAVGIGFIGERDGSLDARLGIELVSPPEAVEKLEDQWQGMIKFARRKAIGWDAGEGYGMHVSINRLALTQLHQGKLLVFVNGNQTLCENVAGRKETTWAKYVSKTLGCAKRHSGEKYEALAIRSGSRLEMRIFRSTLCWDGFRRNLQFAAACVEFTRNCSITELTEQVFLDWLSAPDNAGQFPQLWAHLFPVQAKLRESRAAQKNQLTLKSI